jgi:predicted Rossmann fold flavoprotein
MLDDTAPKDSVLLVGTDLWDVVIIGAGAAGLMAALRAAERGNRALLIEKNSKSGVKILMSGGTRCNITHASDNRGIIAAYGEPGKFLHSALAAFSVEQTINFFNEEGVATKVEEGGKVFPVSNRATDVLQALLRRLTRSGATLALGEPVVDLHYDGNFFRLMTSQRSVHAKKVIITTGGKSYPGCGTTGDGYQWAAAFGHTILPPRPALTPITVGEDWVKRLAGITIRDVALCLCEQQTGAELDRRRGSFLLTHFGVSGPVVLDISRAVTGHPSPTSLLLECDFLPAKSDEQLASEFKNRSASAGRKLLVSILPVELPQRLHEALVIRAGVRLERKAAELTKIERAALVAAYKHQTIPVTGTRGFKHAEVTAGGVALEEVDSRTMESKLASGLYLAGEILDLDGPIGGYNFQSAWSTGWLAGSSV